MSSLDKLHIQDGITGLMWAAKEGSTDVLAVLLTLPQTRINVVDADGDTALAHAAANGQTEVRELEKRKVSLAPLPYCS